jgi:uncharacterized membrane protein YgdD (TMEM256/DUF423 family)
LSQLPAKPYWPGIAILVPDSTAAPADSAGTVTPKPAANGLADAAATERGDATLTRTARVHPFGLSEHNGSPMTRVDPSGSAARDRRTRVLVAAGALLGFTGVAAGAFGAHALKNLVTPDRLAVFETAARYQLVHAVALLGAAWVHHTWPGRAAFAAGVAFLVGTLVFSGSLYALVLAGEPRLGAITPFGGIGLMAGWLLLIVAVAAGPGART